MSVDYLTPDEFEVECAVRNLKGDSITKLIALKSAFENETHNPVLKPFRPHKAASKNPNREIRKCVAKIIEHRDWFTSVKEVSEAAVQITHSIVRLDHVMDRLRRLLGTTRQYKVKCQEAINIGHSVLSSIILVNDGGDLNKSITDINKMTDSLIVEDLSSSEESDEDLFNSMTSSPKTKPIEDHLPSAFTEMHISQQLNASRDIMHQANQAFPQSAKNQKKSLVNYSEPTNYHVQPQIYDNTDQPHNNFQFCQPVKMSKPENREYHNSLPTYNAVSSISRNNYQPTSESPRVHLSQWKINFDGTPEGIPVERFLFRVEHLARTYRITDTDLRNEFGSLLKGIASNWYWCFLERNPHCSWEEFRCAFIKRFQDRRSDFDIRRTIESRKQKPKEPFIEFYNEILALTLQYRSPPAETEILHILRLNMRNGLQIALADQNIESISTLVERCIALEGVWNRTKYVPELLCQQRQISQIDEIENTREKSNLFQMANNTNIDQFNYHSDSLTQSQPTYIDAIQSQDSRHLNPNKTFNASNSNNVDSSLNICWNCQDIGHTFQNCTKPVTKIFCFGCGRNGILKPNCFRCNPGNGRPRIQMAAGMDPRRSWRQNNPITDSASNTDPELKLLTRKH